jgi:hypothetical protein
MCNSIQLQFPTSSSSFCNLSHMICSNTKVTPHFSKILPRTIVPLKKEPAIFRPQSYSLGKTLPRIDTTSSESTTAAQQQHQSTTIEDLRRDQELASSKLPFLWKLHILLDDVEATGNDHIVSWLEHGRSFKVYRPKSFIALIAPHYFKQSKFKSFQRQLHLYEFSRVQYGPEAGSYSHPLFVRGEPNLCLSLSPIKIKSKAGRHLQQRQIVASAVMAQQQQQQRQRTMETSIGNSSSPGKRAHPSSNRSSNNCCAAATAAAATTTSAVLSKRDQDEWVAKIQRMVVKGSTLAAELQQQQSKEEGHHLWTIFDTIHPTTTPSTHEMDGTAVPAVTDDDIDDDTCSLFGVNFHLLPHQEDVSSCEHCCESDTEDETEWSPFLLVPE